MCIYYSTGHLTYTSEEHIFPAAIGGQERLPKGIVSDQFNADISKIEQDLVRNGMLAIVRTIEGPGKRGSQSLSKATKSKVTVVTKREKESNAALGYIVLGKPIEISHVSLNLHNGEFTFSSNKSNFIPKETISKFANKCTEPHNLKLRSFESEFIQEEIVLFGIASGVEENYDAFFCRHPKSAFELTEQRIKMIGESVSRIEDSMAQSATYFPKLHLRSTFDSDHLRIYGKIAFNTLCLIKGQEFVKRSRFDPVRNWIARSDAFNGVALISESEKILETLALPPSSHSVIVTKNEHGLVAQINLYSNFGVYIVLDPLYNEPFSIDGFICDWKNKKEYRLMDQILTVVRHNS